MQKICLTIILLLLVFPQSALALTAGLVGDSISDEYHGDDNRGGSYSKTTFNWLELLSKYRGLDFGNWGNRSDVRRIGFERNFARSGATTSTLIQQGQHTGLANILSAKSVDITIVMIGSNDFAYYYADGYAPIYNGQLTSAQIEQKIRSVVGNIVTAIDTLKAGGAGNMLVESVVDWNLNPVVVGMFPDATKRKRVGDVVAEINRRLKIEVEFRGAVFTNNSELATEVFSKLDANNNLVLDGEKISFASYSDNPKSFILGDKIHSGTVASALLANFYISKINAAWGYNIRKFTDQEILVAAGIRPLTINSCTTDANGDHLTDLADYSLIATSFLPTGRFDPRSDVNLDGTVDIGDYSNWAAQVFKACDN